MDTLRFLFRFARPHAGGYAAGLALVPLSIASALAIPYLAGEAIGLLERGGAGTGAGTGIGGSLEGLLLLLLGVSLARAATLFGMRLLIIGASRGLEQDLRNHLFRRLQTQDQLFFKAVRTGDLLTRLTSDVERARLIAGPVVLYSASTFFMLALAVPLMASIDGTLTLLLLVPLCLLTVAVRSIGPRVHERVFRAQEALSELSSRAQENFAGMRVVKSFAQEEHEVRSFAEIGRRYVEENLRAARLSAWMQPIVGIVGDVAVLAILVAGGVAILTGGMGFGDFVKFSGYQLQLTWPMISIGWVVNQFQRGSVSVLRLRDLLAAEPRVKEPPAPRARARIARGAVSIRDLTFGFGAAPVLRNVSLEVPAGGMVAIVGRTGAGKSTLVSLVPRIYPVPPGTIFIDGTDVNELPLEVLRRAIGFVPQESFLFSRTLEENIAFGVDAWERRDVEAVAGITRLDKDIDQFPRGYEELVGERGVTLSGGQKQRAALARALLIRPRILILDDALSAVDTHTEEEILANLRPFTREFTTIVVAHRLSSIKDAEHIYVLDEGAVAEEGTHGELLKRGGLYAEIYRLQLISEELESL
jgi:ATP-binding cassette subfamily B protein